MHTLRLALLGCLIFAIACTSEAPAPPAPSTTSDKVAAPTPAPTPPAPPAMPSPPPTPAPGELSADAKDFENLCNATERSGAIKLPPGERPQHMAKWLRANVTGKRAVAALSSIATAAPEARAGLLQQAAKEAGYNGPCALAIGQ